MAFKEGRLDDAEQGFTIWRRRRPARRRSWRPASRPGRPRHLRPTRNWGGHAWPSTVVSHAQAIAVLDQGHREIPRVWPGPHNASPGWRPTRRSRDAETKAARAYTPPSDPLLDAVVAGVAHARPVVEARRARGTWRRRRLARVSGAPGAAIQSPGSERPDGDGGDAALRAGSARRWTS